MLSCRNMAPLLSTHSPTAPGGEGGAVRHQRGKTPKWYMKYMTLCFSPQIPRFPLRGTPRRGKGCTRQSADLTPHRYPDRQSAACVIFASYHWTHLRCEGSEGAIPHSDCPTACGGKVVAPATKGGRDRWSRKALKMDRVKRSAPALRAMSFIMPPGE